jgi:hypothetical protein
MAADYATMIDPASTTWTTEPQHLGAAVSACQPYCRSCLDPAAERPSAPGPSAFHRRAAGSVSRRAPTPARAKRECEHDRQECERDEGGIQRQDESYVLVPNEELHFVVVDGQCRDSKRFGDD